MKTLNVEKLTKYADLIRILPNTDNNKRYKRTLSLKLFAMVGFMLFDYI